MGEGEEPESGCRVPSSVPIANTFTSAFRHRSLDLFNEIYTAQPAITVISRIMLPTIRTSLLLAETQTFILPGSLLPLPTDPPRFVPIVTLSFYVAANQTVTVNEHRRQDKWEICAKVHRQRIITPIWREEECRKTPNLLSNCILPLILEIMLACNPEYLRPC